MHIFFNWNENKQFLFTGWMKKILYTLMLKSGSANVFYSLIFLMCLCVYFDQNVCVSWINFSIEYLKAYKISLNESYFFILFYLQRWCCYAIFGDADVSNVFLGSEIAQGQVAIWEDSWMSKHWILPSRWIFNALHNFSSNDIDDFGC